VSGSNRRYFWGHSLAQAVVSAARWHGVAPERLAYRVHEKRHGFVKLRRAVVIEIDPAAPELPPGVAAPPLAVPSRPGGSAPSAREPAVVPERKASADERRGRDRTPRERPRERRRGRPEAETWHAPDEDSVLAGIEATARILTLAGLDLEARVEPEGERLRVELGGPDEARLRELGVGVLDDVEHLLPRAIHGLCGRLVRVRVEGAGLRAEREEELRARARAIAERVLAQGGEELTDALDPGDRRIVHLELADRAGLRTESGGGGLLKRVRIARAE